MVERVVVALDGSPASERVLAPLDRFLGARPAELILTHVRSTVAVYGAAGAAAFVPEGPSDYLRGLEARVAPRTPSPRFVERTGTPVGGILDVAAEEDATLIAMATHGRRGLSRWFWGSVTELVLRESPVPVLAVRMGAEAPGRPWGTLLVPVDGSVDSRSAIPPAVRLARRLGLRIVVLRAVDDDPRRRDAAQRGLQEIVRGMAVLGVTGRATVAVGPPAEAIVRACAQMPIDLIVMATHGRSGWARLQKGSVTEEVLRGAPVPVLAVRAAPEPARAWRRGVEEEAA